LPFENKKEDPIDWIYDKRFGLCVLLMLSFALAVVFIWATVGSEGAENSEEESEYVYIDMSEMEIVEEEQVEPNSAEDWSSVSNTSSNENAAEGEYLRNDKFADDPELKRMQEEVAKDLKANEASYKKSLDDVNAFIDDAKEKELGKQGESENSERKVPGAAVSYSFANPVRKSEYLYKPVYRCEGGGVVVVNAVLDQSGNVVSATVKSGGDDCMRETAISSARKSRFNIDKTAPAKQHGTITYKFSSQ
jgi:hypothetical protein